MTLGSGETSLGEQHRATTESDLPPTLPALHEGNLLIDGHPILNFRLFTSTCKVCGKEIIVWRECVRRNNNVYSWSGAPRARARWLHDNERSVNALANYQFECNTPNTPCYWSPNPSHRYNQPGNSLESSQLLFHNFSPVSQCILAKSAKILSFCKIWVVFVPRCADPLSL